MLDVPVEHRSGERVSIDKSAEEFLDEDVIKVLPRKPVTGRCRLCGQEAVLTKEHIPPKSSGNKRTARSRSLDDWRKRNDTWIGVVAGILTAGAIAEIHAAQRYDVALECLLRAARFAHRKAFVRCPNQE